MKNETINAIQQTYKSKDKNLTATIFLLISNDPNTKILAQRICQNFDRKKIIILGDETITLSKVLKLIIKKRIQPLWVLKQFFSSLKQGLLLKAEHPCQIDFSIKNKNDLKDIVNNHPEINTLLAFRAGILITKDILDSIECINTHYAKLPEYPGLGSVDRALKNKDYNQEATIHKMAAQIDKGEIALVVPYKLSPEKPYWQNELQASEAGVQAAVNFLKIFFESQEDNSTNSKTASVPS